MISRQRFICVTACAVVAVLAITIAFAAAQTTLTDEQQLGKSIFFDDHLSINQNEACAACHAPEAGWTGPESDINAHGAVYEGSIAGRFGNRKPPSAAYATQSPVLYQDKKGVWVGGNFWDGRATGEKLGNPAADQAQGPFLNPAEQALPDPACVVYRVCTGSYLVSFEEVWGSGSCDILWPADVETVCATEGTTVALSDEDRLKSDMAYDQIALSIASYEASPEVSAFTSRFDYSRMGMAKLTPQERVGFALFQGKGKCMRCHVSNGKDPLFTDYTYDNLGVPKNPENPVYDYDPGFVDEGLGGYLESVGYPSTVYGPELGKMKVPTLRNVDLQPDGDFVKAYSHNGYFKSLEGIVHFYNTRDVLDACPGDYTEAEALDADCWPAPEVSANVNTAELGDLGLTPEEEAAIVAFLKTLSDGYQP
jgi:cytochrome c peroxidase